MYQKFVVLLQLNLNPERRSVNRKEWLPPRKVPKILQL